MKMRKTTDVQTAKTTGDVVLQESQTAYESTDSDNVLMQVSISRHNEDLVSGKTGELDLNADGYARNETDQRACLSHYGSFLRLTRSRRNSSGSKRTPRYWTRSMPC